MMTRRSTALLSVALAALAEPGALAAQAGVTTPVQQLGHDFGDDYYLANYEQITDYWRTLEEESDRIVVRQIGTTAEGRPHLMAIVTSPENQRNLEHYREISERLARAEGLTDAEARALAEEGKAVVWIDGGLHASESLGAQQLAETVYRMVSGEDPETLRFLDDVIILFVHANPDGNDLVANWYMREADPLERSTGGLPELYQKYIGHDNNRDFFASTQAETENINRVLYREWFPQILYNHHQSGPAGTVFWSPPFRDPFNYHLNPILVLGFQSLGAAMHTRMAVEGKPGATMRSGGPYDGWWNGGIRNTAAFHNTIAVLTEMIGNPTPMRVPLVMDRQLPIADQPYPVPPQEWHFRQSIDYSVSLNRAVLDYASRMRSSLLYDRYVMGKQEIEAGSRDSWTANPRRYAEMADELGQSGGGGRGRGGGGNAERDMAAWATLHAPELRDPRGFIIPSDQDDFPTATKFVDALLEVGIEVERATSDFQVQGTRYPAGSYVVMTDQAFRPHILDMFEPQVHPNVFPVPGGPPTPPYDNAGWTLAFQMGVDFDRILEGFSGPFEPIDEWNTAPPPGRITGAPGATGFVTSRRVNDAYTAVNRLLAAGEEVYALTAPVTAQGRSYPTGSFYVRARGSTPAALEPIARELGVSFDGATGGVPDGATRLRQARVGLWDQYGGSIDSGWARWILEQFEFPYERVFPPDLDRGSLNDRYDVLVFVGGGIPRAGGGGGRGGFGGGGPDPADVPPEYRGRIGRVTAERTIPQVRSFLEGGGRVVAIGSSAPNLAQHLGLPVADHLVEDGRPLERSEFFTPGSVLSGRFDTGSPAAFGMTEHTDLFFDDSPVLELEAGAEAAGVHRVGWFDTDHPLRSGWSWGEEHLEGGVIAIDAAVGRGRVYLFTPEILNRAQPHGTFKLLFNAIYGG